MAAAALSVHILHIFRMRPEKKMIRVNAGANIALVADTHTLRYMTAM